MLKVNALRGGTPDKRQTTRLNSHARYNRLKYNIAVNDSLDSGFDSAGVWLPPVFCNMAK